MWLNANVCMEMPHKSVHWIRSAGHSFFALQVTPSDTHFLSAPKSCFFLSTSLQCAYVCAKFRSAMQMNHNQIDASRKTKNKRRFAKVVAFKEQQNNVHALFLLNYSFLFCNPCPIFFSFVLFVCFSPRWLYYYIMKSFKFACLVSFY